MADRFRIIDTLDAESLGVPGLVSPRLHIRCLLVEFDGDRPVRIVGEDGGEPEDQTLTRDWRWVADEMNRLVERATEAVEAEREACAALLDAMAKERGRTGWGATVVTALTAGARAIRARGPKEDPRG